MVLLILIPIKWLFHWEYTIFSDKPIYIYIDIDIEITEATKRADRTIRTEMDWESLGLPKCRPPKNGDLWQRGHYDSMAQGVWLNDTRVLASGLLKRIVLPYVVLYDYFISFYLVIFYSIIALYLHYSYIYILYVVYHVNCITLEKYRKILY